MSAPRQHNTKEENETIKNGGTPEDWEKVRRGDAGGRDWPGRARVRLAHVHRRGVPALRGP